MRPEFLFTILYTLLFIWLVPAIPFVKNSGLGNLKVRMCILFKLMTGVAVAYYFAHTSMYSDYLGYNEDGRAQYELLLAQPKLFFTDFNADADTYGYGGLLDASYSFWGYLRFNLLFKFIGLMDLLTRGNFYLNCVLFSSFVFFAHIAFYRIYADIYQQHQLKLLLLCFLIPSLLVYTACPHKDGLIFMAMGAVSFVFYRYLKTGKLGIKGWVLSLLALSCIFLLRNYVLLALLPALLTAWLCKVMPLSKTLVVAGSYLLYASLFFLFGFVSPSANLPEAVVKRKADFALQAVGATDLPMRELRPGVTGFISNLPQALNHSLLRPYIWEFGNKAVWLTAIELMAYQVLFLAFILFGNLKTGGVHVFNIYGWAFFLTMMLIIGYTIPNVGAIVRYRSLVWIFVLCPMLAGINWQRLPFWRTEG